MGNEGGEIDAQRYVEDAAPLVLAWREARCGE